MPAPKRHDAEIPMDEGRVRALLRSQFPSDRRHRRTAGRQGDLGPRHVLATWRPHIRDAIERVSDRYDTAPMLAAWEEAVAADEWDRSPVWFHGDLAGNLVVRTRGLT